MLAFNVLRFLAFAVVVFFILRFRFLLEKHRVAIGDLFRQVENIEWTLHRTSENGREDFTKCAERIEKLELTVDRLTEALRKIQDTPQAREEEAARAAIQELVRGS